jgi:hypothetical protein
MVCLSATIGSGSRPGVPFSPKFPVPRRVEGTQHESLRRRGYGSKQAGHVSAPTENGPKLSRNKPWMERSENLEATDRQSA